MNPKEKDAIKDSLENADPEMVPLNLLDELNDNLSNPRHNIMNQLQDYANTGHVGNLIKANNHLSIHLQKLVTLAAMSQKSRAVKPLKSVERAADELNKILVAKNEEFQKNTNELLSKINTSEKELDDLDKLIKSNKEETNGLIGKWQEQFSNAQESRSVDFSELRERLAKEARDNIDEINEKSQAKVGKVFDDFTNGIEIYIDDAETKHQRILELYGLVAGDSVAASFVENANEEKSAANFWRVISILFILGTLAWLGLAYNLNSAADLAGLIHWPKLFITISISGVALFGAAYSAQQSTKHRNIEKNTRRFALEVKAIDPFIASLTDEDKSELKKNLSDKLFGHANDSETVNHNIIDEHAFGTAFKWIEKIAEKFSIK